MSLELFNVIPTGAIEVLTDVKGMPYFKRADLGRFLGIVDIRHMFKNVVVKSRYKILREGGVLNPSLKQSQNYHDTFVSLDGALEIVVRSKKPKAVELVKWLTRKGLKKVVEETQQAIEEKDMQLALINDDLTEAQLSLEAGFQEIVMLEQGNLELQNQVNELQQRAVPHLADARKNNGLAVIQKNNDGDEYPYVAICGQQGYVANPDRVRHFGLGEHYTHQRLMELREA